MAWSFGECDEVLRSPGFEFELVVRSQGRNITALIGLIGPCSGSDEVRDGKQYLLHPVVTCLAGAGEDFNPPLLLRFPVGDVDSMESGPERGRHDDAEVAYRAHLESTFSAFKRKDASSEWVPITGKIVPTKEGVFCLEVMVKHFCKFGVGEKIDVQAGCLGLVELSNRYFKNKSRESHYHFVNLGTEDLTLYIWGADQSKSFTKVAEGNLGFSPMTGAASIGGKVQRDRRNVHDTRVIPVLVPGGPVGRSWYEVCRVLDGMKSPPRVAWTTPKRIAPSWGVSGHYLVQVWGTTPMRDKTRPRVRTHTGGQDG